MACYRERLLWLGLGCYFIAIYYKQVAVLPMEDEATLPFLEDALGVSSSHTNGISRIAYLITTNETSPRTQTSMSLLQRVGFDVQLEFAPTNTSDKILSNKLAQLSIYRKIIADQSRPWGYVFEDDIDIVGRSVRNWNNKVPFSVELQVKRQLERSNEYFFYLGICGPESMGNHLYCGTCAHAYGISRRGATMLIDFEATFEDSSDELMDIVTKHWCFSLGGFPVSHYEHTSIQTDDHRGTFYQDRNQFKSTIWD